MVTRQAKKPARRTQAQRRQATSRALLDSAIASVNGLGVAGATVQLIARRAGATTGAVQHLFGHRDGLMLAVVEDFGGHLQAVSKAVVGDGSIAQRVSAGIDAYWNLFSGEHFLAVVQIMLEARHDPALYAKMFERMKGYEAELDRHWVRMFQGCGIGPQRIKVARHLAIAALRGLSVRMVYRQDRTRWSAELRLLKELIAEALVNPAKRSA
jgi:AcrR family transcriptional regulator